MKAADLIALTPLLVIAAGITGIMVLLSFYRRHRAAAGLCIAALFISYAVAASGGPSAALAGSLLLMDGQALFYMKLICLSGIAVAALSHGYLDGRRVDPEEYYILLLLAVLGAMVLAGSGHFFSLFLGLEVLSVSLYGMIAYGRTSEAGIEAGIKYLVLAAVSASFLLFGMALVYGKTGTMAFGVLSKALQSSASDIVLLSGTGLIIIGIGFKLALVPFHLWTPDVYEGAPAPVSAFIATVSKGAVLALLIRYLGPYVAGQAGTIFTIFAALAVVSMFTGNILALLQDNLKRMLAYSSIAHMGYLMVAFLSAGRAAAAFYIAAYFVTTLGAFGVISALSGKKKDAGGMEELAGLSSRNPWLAAVLSVMLFSLAGMPVTAGFVAKLYILKAGAEASLWILIIAFAVNSAIGLFYYLRVIAAVYRTVPEGRAHPVEMTDRLVIAALVVLLIYLGLYPGPFISLIEAAMGAV